MTDSICCFSDAGRVGADCSPIPSTPITCEADTRGVDRERFARFHRGMRERGVLLPPSQLECAFLSLAHSDADVDAIGDAATDTLKEIDR